MCNRRIGHTHTLLNGTINNDSPVIIVTNFKNSEGLFKSPLEKKKDIIMSLSGIVNGGLRGCQKPMVIDNAALTVLCGAAAEKIENLEESYKLLVNIIDNVAMPQIKELERENEILKNKLDAIKQIL